MSVELGVAQADAGPSTLPGATLSARMVRVALVPSGVVLEARVANIGQGAGRGLFAPIKEGDELIVLCPGGDRNRAVVLGGLGSNAAPNPTDNLGTAMLALHPGGVQLSHADGQPMHGIVHGELLASLVDLLTALTTFMTTMSTATGTGVAAPVAGVVAAASSTFLADTGVLQLIADMAASANSGIAPGVGGPPFATTHHKVTP